MQNMQQDTHHQSTLNQLTLHYYFRLNADERQPPLTMMIAGWKNRGPMTMNVQQPRPLSYMRRIFKSTGQQLNILALASDLS